MLASFLACGYTAGEIEKMLRSTNFKAFKDAKKGLLAKMENLYLFFLILHKAVLRPLMHVRFKNFGMYEGKVFYEWMGRRIAEKTDNPDILSLRMNSSFSELIP